MGWVDKSGVRLDGWGREGANSTPKRAQPTPPPAHPCSARPQPGHSSLVPAPNASTCVGAGLVDGATDALEDQPPRVGLGFSIRQVHLEALHKPVEGRGAARRRRVSRTTSCCAAGGVQAATCLHTFQPTPTAGQPSRAPSLAYLHIGQRTATVSPDLPQPTLRAAPSSHHLHPPPQQGAQLAVLPDDAGDGPVVGQLQQHLQQIKVVGQFG